MQRIAWNADGERLIVPRLARLAWATELGRLDVAPGARSPWRLAAYTLASCGDAIGSESDQDPGPPVILASAMLSLLFRISIVNPGIVSRPMPMGSPVSGSGWIFP